MATSRFCEWFFSQYAREDEIGQLVCNLMPRRENFSSHGAIRRHLELLPKKWDSPYWLQLFLKATQEFDAVQRYGRKRYATRDTRALPAPQFKSQMQPRPGQVYLLQAEGTQRIKIGRSTSAALRFESLRTASPFPLVLLRTIAAQDCVALEAALHRRYARYRQHREWFDLPAYILDALLKEDFSV